MSNPATFAQNIRKFADKTKLSMDFVVRKVGMDIARSLIGKSPVDTGRFRGNWMLGVGSVNTETVDAIDRDGNPTWNRIRAGLGEVRAGGVFYITNSLPYAIPLEYGHSQQAPSGMVRLTVVEYKSYIESAVRERK